MPNGIYKSWGFAKGAEQSALVPQWRSDAAGMLDTQSVLDESVLPFGRGRSYGDSCLNSDGVLLDTKLLGNVISFDSKSGVITCEAGMRLVDILRVIVPNGWFLPVTPGTSFATLGGAIANDVHGKNHHCDGTFGRFVEQLVLIRSDASVLTCSVESEQALFNATIGGLGLTGLIQQATIKLIPITSDELDVSFQLFQGLDAFCELSKNFKSEHQYTVAWLDCSSDGDRFGRGVFMAANHRTHGKLNLPELEPRLGVPINLPTWVLNRYSIGMFNRSYYSRHKRLNGQSVAQGFSQYFYPLDAIANWNRIYGKNGFHQYQFVLPFSEISTLEKLLKDIVASGLGSFLAVLKEFGDIESPGLLSFPREGLCLALDFADRGVKTERLIQQLDDIVMQTGGAAYPAKDRLMSADAFKQYFPNYQTFNQFVDPNHSSDFWRRVSG